MIFCDVVGADDDDHDDDDDVENVEDVEHDTGIRCSKRTLNDSASSSVAALLSDKLMFDRHMTCSICHHIHTVKSIALIRVAFNSTQRVKSLQIHCE